ncbi:WxcM-like domain-containing protein [Cellulophaga omnivescoria]|uniref:WxcM-like domain-containing protein n=1 Tax=Cellulophaga omnivescoria TaxID=1888890 RepID=UPI000984A2D1|nr:WxcM-like domain-containing protein [Cellulophaga omnivescoria]WBU88814.1 WxcM-like domain-containing protein [Cellulophaga omnivescoria]
MISHNIIAGNSHIDERGKLNFFNQFNLKEIVRMYEISPSSTTNIRGWQGHAKEHKWFYCSAGSFTVYLVPLTYFNTVNAENKSEDHISEVNLSANSPSILHITGGYATAFKAKEENATLLVFSNFSVEESVADDFRFKLEEWPINQ